MTFKEAKKMLKRAERNGYAYNGSGLVSTEHNGRMIWGIDIDGDGICHNFGCPKIIWSQEQADEFFEKP